MPEETAQELGLPPSITYGEAYGVVERSGDRRLARDYVGALLALRRDKRVQGIELR